MVCEGKRRRTDAIDSITPPDSGERIPRKRKTFRIKFPGLLAKPEGAVATDGVPVPVASGSADEDSTATKTNVGENIEVHIQLS